MIKDHLDVVQVDGGTDYRRMARGRVNAYLSPLNIETEHQLDEMFRTLAAEQPDETRAVLKIEAREIHAHQRRGRLIWFDFQTLCGGPRSQNDYLELAHQFDIVMLSGVPKMSAAMSSEARRFTWLVDVLYDHKVKLIMSAAVQPTDLYTDGVLANEFHRTVSRLVEMQSADYLATSKRATQTHFV
jgi:cell division protein ZapE